LLVPSQRTVPQVYVFNGVNVSGFVSLQGKVRSDEGKAD